MSKPTPGKILDYSHALGKYVEQMMFELLQNHDKKGNFLDWKPQNAGEMIVYLDEHYLKLQEALKAGDVEKVTEYAADCGNILMLIERRFGLTSKEQ